MRKTVLLALAGTTALVTAAVMFMVSNMVSLHAQSRPLSSYGEDRAAIEDLQARYLFALDFHDPNLYVSTFTPDGVLDTTSRISSSRWTATKRPQSRIGSTIPTTNPQRRGVFDGFGHYEDELVKVNGKWLFTKRKIYNEGRDEWAYKGGKNPAW